MRKKEKLKICSVDYKSRTFLELNWKLTDQLNDKDSFS